MAKKILIVDDEEPIRELAKDYLEGKGFEVITAADGKQGLSEAKSKHPDLIILDVNMPKMDGFRVLSELKKDKKTMYTPVFMLTTRKSDEDVQQGMELYADKYLPKPFMPETLLAEIQKTFALQGS